VYFTPTIYDIMCYVFTFGVFFTFFFLFAKFFPVINMAEVKAVLKDSDSKVYKGRRSVPNSVVPQEHRVSEKEIV
jgi:hypothetical protein